MNDKQAKEILRLLENCPPFSLIEFPKTDRRSGREFRISVTHARDLGRSGLDKLYHALNSVGEVLEQAEEAAEERED